LGQAKKDADHSEARAAEEQLFPVLCDILNKYHGSQHGSRFWRIVLGHWLHRYADVMLNRIRTLEYCLQSFCVSGIACCSDERYSLASYDSLSGIYAFNNDCWNTLLSVHILKKIWPLSCSVEILPDVESAGCQLDYLMSVETRSGKLHSYLRKFLQDLLASCSKESDAFIINSYLPKKEEIKLQLALGQCPQMWVSRKLSRDKNPDRLIRSELSTQLATKSGDTLMDIMSGMLFEVLPVCFLEGYAGLNEAVDQMPWPKKPKFIFTSNNFDTDELFKLWVAGKVEQGVKYFVGQHGNNYGTTRNHVDPTNEEVTADKFLTWGWTDGLPQQTPAFIFKKTGINNAQYDPMGQLLLIELCLPPKRQFSQGLEMSPPHLL